MPRILIVKTSSLGDVVHNLPAVSDIAAALPHVEIDWAIEEDLAPIAKLHPAVTQTIKIALRRWRKAWWTGETLGEVREFVHALRATRYDAVVDTQGLLKSALVTRAARGRRYGLDWSSSREPLSMFYDETFRVPWGDQAVVRNRMLAAQALRYALPPCVAYGIAATHTRLSWLSAQCYAVLIHSTSAPEKLWPEAQWIALGNALAARGVCTVLPWGTPEEERRSLRLSDAISGSVTPPRLQLVEVTALLSQAQCAIGVDTGLTHLAGALGVPTVGIYRATDPRLTGLYQCAHAVNLGGVAEHPTAEDVLHALDRL